MNTSEAQETAEYVQAVRGEITRLAMQHHSADRLGVALGKVLQPHTEYGIYDECEHDHQQIGWNGSWPVYEPGVVLVDEIGTTCNQVASACTHCCTEQIHGGDEVQREDCADASHDVFWRGCWPCQTWLDAGDALGIPRPDSLAARLPKKLAAELAERRQ